MPLDDYKAGFLNFAIARGALKFGEFTLKSGRVSPYFFNAGAFNTGAALASLGEYYAKAILAAGVEFDLLFGPAYKGIPLVSTTAVALARDHGQDYPYVFNRKEAKTHGEGGSLIGAELIGRALIIDDVITAGTAIREVMAIIKTSAAQAAGVVVAIDRQEKGQGELSAIQEVARDYAIPVVSVVTFADIVRYLEIHGDHTEHLASMRDYRARFGIDP